MKIKDLYFYAIKTHDSENLQNLCYIRMGIYYSHYNKTAQININHLKRQKVIKLTKFTLISLQVLVFLSDKLEKKTAEEIYKPLDISKNHLAKVINFMNKENWIEASRGKGGGVKLKSETMDVPLNILIERTEKFARKENQRKKNYCMKENLIMKEIEKAQEEFYKNLCIKSINEIINTDHLS